MPTDQDPPNGTQHHAANTLSDLPLVLTATEVAKVLRCDRKSVYAMISRGELPGSRKVGRAVRIDRRSLVRWLRAGAST